jgi:OOP family OmpA-OmpF porin
VIANLFSGKFSNLTIENKEKSMKAKQFLKIFGVLIIGIFLSSFASTAGAFTCTGGDLNPQVTSGELVKNVDNFLVLLDASSTMSEKTKSGRQEDETKLPLARDLIKCMNETIPDITMNGGMRAFGPYHLEKGLIYGMIDYTKAGLNNTVVSVDKTGGTTPIGDSIQWARKDLQMTTGKTAVILFSDGMNSMTGDPIAEAAGMKQQYGKDICIYTVLLGNDTAGKANMDGIAKAGECGFATDATALLAGNAMTNFVTSVFLAKGKMKERVSITLHVEFDFDKDSVRPEYHSDIMKVANFLKAYPKATAVLEGHTDGEGSEDYNLNLSKKRAKSIKKYLVDKFVIRASRISTRGFGESQPVASNKTKEGRQQNRRVVANIATYTTK